MSRIAYFCMEYGLHERFKIYGGGLGILAGDHLKEAFDQKVPLVGLGILWRQGYTNQVIEQGAPVDRFEDYEYDFLQDTGLEFSLVIGNRPVFVRVFKVDAFQNAPLYLLCTNHEQNGKDDRDITAQLYGGDAKRRVAQEMVLGIGGVRVLRMLGLDPEVYHFNEGHAVFAGVELIRELMEKGLEFEEALLQVREKIVFTTHTPVPAGNESHYLSLLKEMGAYNGLDYEQMHQIGGNPFGMTVAGLRLSRISNGVSALHAKTAQSMWKDVEGASPIIGITNGVHPASWQDDRVYLASEDKEELWESHRKAKGELLAFILEKNKVELDPAVLLIGFGRRSTPYKRADLIFENPKMIGSLLDRGKVQLVFSGKSHPLDTGGKALVSRILSLAKKYPKNIVFLENYDMKIGALLTRGCDVWLNNPEYPQEASGTSGMKAAMNGVLNFSVLDGWWPEGCVHGENGWKIGSGRVSVNSRALDSKALYQVLLQEILPTYYRDKETWIQMMQASIKMSSEAFSSARMLKEYLEKMYQLSER